MPRKRTTRYAIFRFVSFNLLGLIIQTKILRKPFKQQLSLKSNHP